MMVQIYTYIRKYNEDIKILKSSRHKFDISIPNSEKSRLLRIFDFTDNKDFIVPNCLINGINLSLETHPNTESYYCS